MYAFRKAAWTRAALITIITLLCVGACVTAFIVVFGMNPHIIDKGELPGKPEGLSTADGYIAYSAPEVADISLCGIPACDGNEAMLYLTNPETNSVLIKAEIYTVKEQRNVQNGNVSYLPDKLIGKTGFIHPGCYVPSVRINGITLGENTKIMIKICTMVEDSGKSNGTFYIRTVIK